MHRKEKLWFWILFGGNLISIIGLEVSYWLAFFGSMSWTAYNFWVTSVIIWAVAVYVSFIVYGLLFRYKVKLSKTVGKVTYEKEKRVWFSWLTLFLGPIQAAINNDWKAVLFQLIVPFYWIYYVFKGNKHQIQLMIEDGWVPADSWSKNVIELALTHNSPFTLRDLGVSARNR